MSSVTDSLEGALLTAVRGGPIVIISDEDGVRNNYSARDYVQTLARIAGLPLEEALEIVLPISSALCNGQITLPAFENMLISELGIPRQEIRWVEYYRDDVEVNPIVMGAQSAFKSAGGVLAVMTNEDRTRGEIIRARSQDPSLRLYLPYNMGGLSKPDPQSYQFVVSSLSEALGVEISLDNILFADDSKRNVDGAPARMNKLHYRDAHDYIARMESFLRERLPQVHAERLTSRLARC